MTTDMTTPREMMIPSKMEDKMNDQTFLMKREKCGNPSPTTADFLPEKDIKTTTILREVEKSSCSTATPMDVPETSTVSEQTLTTTIPTPNSITINNNNNHHTLILSPSSQNAVLSTSSTPSTEATFPISSLPVLFLTPTLLSLCNLSPSQFILYLSSLEPQIPDLSTILNSLLQDVIANNAPNISTTTTSSILPAVPHAPIYLYHKHSIKRKANHLASEELLAKVNGFLLSLIFYSFHRKENMNKSHPNQTTTPILTTEDRQTQEQELYQTKKQVFQQRYSELINQTKSILSELDYYYLVNYEYVITWIYQNIFSIGKQVNQEYVIIAGMALEGSHRILSRGGGSGNVRKLREEIYRMVSGKAKQKRCKRESPKNGGVGGVGDKPETEMVTEVYEETMMKKSPIVNIEMEDNYGEEQKDSPMIVVGENEAVRRIACYNPEVLKSPSSPLLPSLMVSSFTAPPATTGKRGREEESENEAVNRNGNVDSSDEEASNGSKLHWKKKIKLNEDIVAVKH